MEDKYKLKVTFNGDTIVFVAYLIFMYKLVKKIF